MKKQKTKIQALVLSNIIIWFAFAMYAPYALASDSYEEGDRTTHVRVSHPTNEESDLSAEETEHICGLDSVVCPVGEETSERDASPKPHKAISTSPAGKIIATISFYSAIDSCHTGASCLMANGKRAEVGYAACPRRYKLGTKVRIDGKTYECGDRTAKFVDGRWDIFTGYGIEAYRTALSNGIKKLKVEIL